MGTSLTGLTPATTYDALIKVGDNGPIDGTLKALSDGLGNDLPMEASTTGINFTGALQQSGVAVPTASQVAAKQDTLVSGTNIKTINGTSVLGSGNIVTPTTSPSGVAGAIQFSNGSAFASDATNLFWDDTNNRLGIGTNNAYAATLQVKGVGTSVGTNAVFVENSAGLPALIVRNNGTVNLPGNLFAEADITVGNGNTSLGARLGIKGSGSTSATTSLLVQNSAGNETFRVKDNGETTISWGGGSHTWTFNQNTFSIGSNNAIISSSAGTIITSTFSYNGGVLATDNGAKISDNNLFTAKNATAVLEANSTTRGFLPPRMTTTQKNAIATPAAGLVVYDSTMNATCEYNGTAWRVVSAGAQSVAASTATTTVDMSAGNVQNITLTASTTLTLSSAAVGTYILKLIQGGSGSYTVTWPGTVIWSGGTAPTLTTTVGKVDIVTLVFDGTNYYGNYSLNY